MGNRFATRIDRDDGPTPFSSDWVHTPGPVSHTRPLLTFPSWMPGERTLSAALVLVLVMGIALFAGKESAPRFASGTANNGRAAYASSSGQTSDIPLAAPDPPLPSNTEGASIAPADVGGANQGAVDQALAVGGEIRDPVGGFTIAAQLEATPSPGAAANALLPTNRILAYYGHPHDSNMGIVGEYSKEDVLSLLLQQKAEYETADPSRAVIPAFELIATVAQREPGADGTYVLDTDLATLTEYADFIAANGGITILDLQIGHGSVAAEIEKIRPLLERPDVHLALDPEFAMAPGEIPGDQIGSLGSDSIVYAQNLLAQIAAEQGLPPKLLIVHQFREDMIVGKDALKPVAGVQLVIDADGYGAPELKTQVFNYLVTNELIEFGGIKLFYKQDVPLMSAGEVLALIPSPDFIVYQ